MFTPLPSECAFFSWLACVSESDCTSSCESGWLLSFRGKLSFLMADDSSPKRSAEDFTMSRTEMDRFDPAFATSFDRSG